MANLTSIKKMDISVIVPIYGVENYIERCLRSLFTQTKTDGVEFILVNDATPDRSMEVARKVIAEYPNLNIQIIEHKENRHVAATRQTGLDVATGDYIIQIDSDDWCDAMMLEQMWAKAQEEESDIVISNFYRGDCGHIVEQIEEYDNIKCIRLALANKILGYLWFKLFRRSLFFTYNISFDEGVNIREDLLVSIKLYYRSNKITYIPKPYLHYTTSRDCSITNNIIPTSDLKQFYYGLESFFQQNNIYDESIRYELLKIKFKLTVENLRKTIEPKVQREYIEMFPEIKKDIFKITFFPITTKIPLYLASIGMYYLSAAIFYIAEQYRTMKHK